MTIILKPFALLLGWLYAVTGSYALAIVIFALIFKVLLFPISMRGRKSTLDMSRLSDRQKDLQAKYGRDRMRYQEEVSKLYATEGVKPSGGCLWMFIPMPVLMALYFIISQPFTYLMGLTAKGEGSQVARLAEFISGDASTGIMTQLRYAQDVHDRFAEVQAALPDIAAQITSHGGPIDFTMFGLNLSKVPSLMFWQNGFSWQSFGLFLIPIFSAIFAYISMIVSQRINKRIIGSVTKQDRQQRTMMLMQPAISLYIGFTLPAALGVYWTANAIFAIVQEYAGIGILKKHLAEKREAAEQKAINQKEEERERKKKEAETRKKKVEEARRIKMERKLSTDGISESRVGMRAYAKGRTYDQERYPVTPYHDPDDIIREKRAEREAYQAEAAAKGGKKRLKEAELLPVDQPEAEETHLPVIYGEDEPEIREDAETAEEVLEADDAAEVSGDDETAAKD